MNTTITEKTYPIESRWILKSLWRFVVVTLIFFVLFIVELLLGKAGTLGAYLIVYIIIALASVSIIYLQRADFHYSLDDKFVVLNQGVLSKQQRNIPYGVIQNIFVKQDIFDRIFGLASLVVENASYGGGGQVMAPAKVFGLTINTSRKQQSDMIGFSGNRISIPGLSRQNADSLKAIILQKMQENPVEDSQSGL